MNPSLISLRDVGMGYGGPEVLTGVTMDVPRGQIVALVGRNGAGKSTLLRTMRGFLSPSHGTVLIKGRSAASFQPGALAAVVGFLSPATPQSHITVDEVMELSSLGRLPSLDAFLASDHPAVFSEVYTFGRRFMDAMSSGQQRKVMLLALVAQWTDVLLMDEPELHLDLPSLRSLYALIRWATARGKSVVLSTHNLETIRTLPDRLYMVKARSVCEVSRSEETIEALFEDE